MDQPNHFIQIRTSEWPTGLKSIDEAARDLGILPDRLASLADGGFAPHFRIDGGPPLFKISELKRWAGTNLVDQVEGRPLPSPVRVVVPAPAVQDWRKVPAAMKEIVGLCDITDEILRTGIYFLCRGDVVLYVGQSVNAAARIADHYRRYEFESVYFLPWPADDLNRMEAAMIRSIRPVLNGKTSNGKMRTSAGDHSIDEDVLAQVSSPVQTAEIGQ